MKRLLIFLILIGAFVLIGFWLIKPSRAPEFVATSGILQSLSEQLPKQESFPDPLRKLEQSLSRTPVETLRPGSIISLTNKERQLAGHAGLTENKLLTKAAAVKLEDMFEQQYFEHVSPDGKGPSDVIGATGYAYIMVGENLAEGDFRSNEELVQGWMNSPGHRENILKPQYTEIGVAVRQGTYQGKRVWMAVQEFGRPRSDCPQVDEGLKATIAGNEVQITVWQRELKSMSDSMATARAQGDYEAYNAMVPAYNERAGQINTLSAEAKSLVSAYNAQVAAFNACIQ